MNEVDIVVRVQDKTAAGAASVKKNVSQASEKSSKSMKDMSQKFAVSGGVAAAALAKLGKDAFSNASDLEQSSGTAQAIFGKNYAKIAEASNKAAGTVGLSKSQYQDAASAIGGLFKNMGVSAQALPAASQKMIKFGADLSAIGPAGSTAKGAIEAITAAYKGEFDPLQQYGITITQAKINTEAMTVAHVKSVAEFNKLTQAQQAAAKQQATTNILQKQGASALGQFKIQSGSAAEAAQILKARYTNLSASLGAHLLPVITQVEEKLISLIGWMQRNPAVVKAVAIAVGGLTVAMAALAVAMMANPAGLIVVGLYALAVAFGVAWAKSEKFRTVVSNVFATVSSMILSNSRIILRTTKAIADGVLDMVIVMLRALGKIPGNGWAKKAADDVEGFRNKVDSGFNAAIRKTKDWQAAVDRMPKVVKLKSDISDLQAKISRAKASLKTVPKSQQSAIRANIAQLQDKVRTARGILDRLNGKTVNTYINTHLSTTTRNGHTAPSEMMAHGGITGAAGGGPRSGYTMVGEQGRELVKLAPGSQVYPHGTTEAMMARGGGGTTRVLLEWVGGNAGDEFMSWLKKNIRIRGGNVQAVLGR